tara:strand:- start:1323 stop:1538 length:216 start_codon:yes stop_codon:yes gene_type:complete
MIATKCLVCGSSSMRADRALSGRLVCNSCGAPFGVRRRVNKKMKNTNIFSLNNKYFLFICILILAFTLVII